MPKSGGDRARIAFLRLEISRLLLGGLSERAISRRVGRACSTVHYHIKQILAEWQAEQRANRNKWVSVQLARIARIEQLALEEFQLSKLGKSSQSVKGRGLALMRGRRATMTAPIIEVEQIDRHATTTGNVEYLTKLCWCVSERNKILGLYHPNSEPFLVEHEPDVDRYDQARRHIASLVDAQSIDSDG